MCQLRSLQTLGQEPLVYVCKKLHPKMLLQCLAAEVSDLDMSGVDVPEMACLGIIISAQNMTPVPDPQQVCLERILEEILEKES